MAYSKLGHTISCNIINFMQYQRQQKYCPKKKLEEHQFHVPNTESDSKNREHGKVLIGTESSGASLVRDG
ncbi:hypothetical protein [Candidatus Nitrosotalea okcheonensis]|uniref:hypothetical protein n=1 Tax=Candidatus Nitrosotalea okcheonensis TaxID=1903276 RepID=UPI0012FFF411|nr:hypothetical protein [Candidatus Nitrosotalea okcheonensis]